MRKLRIIFLFFSLSLLSPPALAEEVREIYHLVNVKLMALQDVRDLQKLGLEIEHFTPDGLAEVVIRDWELPLLSGAGFTFEVKIWHMASFYKNRLKAGTTGGRDFANGSMGGNYTLSEIEGILDDWAALYPDLITPKTSIGSSILGKEIWAVKISDNPGIDEDEPEISFDSLIHAREPQSMMTLLYYMKNLLEGYGVDPELTHLVDSREIWFIPVHNPDGYYYNEQTDPGGGGMWRKNLRENGDGSYGVDLNRNYGFQWGYDNYGSSGNPWNETYRGTEPFSEPETQAVRDFIQSRPIVTSWNTHTYADVYICPFGYDDFYPYGNDWNIYQEYLNDISVENGYTVGTIYDVMYACNGCSTDWHYGSEGVFNIAVEIGGDSDGFWPPQERIIPLAEENQLALRYFSWVAGSYVVVLDYAFTDSNGDGIFHPGEPVKVALTLRNKGLAGTGTDVVASLSPTSPYVKIIEGSHNFGIIPSLTSVENASSPLKFRVLNTTPYGQAVTLNVDVSFDGYTHSFPISLMCGVPHLYYSFDMESEQGWTVGDVGDNATTGIWERGDPVGIFYGGQPIQPEEDHTPPPGTHCFVTGNGDTSAGSDDVDNGKTTLKSPVLDLNGLSDIRVSYWRWYADLGSVPNDDIFLVNVSNNGGSSWEVVESLDHTENSWERVAFTLDDHVAPTGNVMMRFIAKDEPNNSLCEACIDDVEFTSYSSPIALSLSAPPVVGTTINVIIDAHDDPDLDYVMAASTGTFPGIPIGERLFPLQISTVLKYSLNPDNGTFNNFYGTLNSSGHSEDPEIVIPNFPGIQGMKIFVAAVTRSPSYPQGIKSISAPLPIVFE